MTPQDSHGRCRLLELPAEIREQIWIHTVTTWTRVKHRMLERQPIRIDRINQPVPPSITQTSAQLRAETLHLYYQHNIFECWRPHPHFWMDGLSHSTFVSWLSTLLPEKIAWLNSVILLFKNPSELEYDIESDLKEKGFELGDGVLSFRQELSEYEMCYEELGLPRYFGKQRRSPWVYSST